MDLSTGIRKLRKNKELSQRDLAKKAGITQAALSNIENGQRPHPETLEALSRALQVSVAFVYLMGLEREDVPAHKQGLYDQLFPVIEGLVSKLSE